MATILIVEDNRSLNHLYAQVLKMVGFDTLQAFSCKEALECLTQAVPAVIILDMLLPDGNGTSVLSHVRETARFQKVHVIAVSGSDEDIARASELSIDLVMVKPVSVPNLVDCVGRIVGQYAL